jgi:hypothetical protein
MSSLAGYLYQMWLGVKWSSSPVMQQAVIPRLNDYKEIGRLAVRPSLPVSSLTGRSKDGPLTASFVNVVFPKSFLRKSLWEEGPEETAAGTTPFWHVDEFAKRAKEDIVVVGGSTRFVQSLPAGSALVVPEYIDHTIDVSGDWEQVTARIPKSTRKHELRRIRKYGWEFSASRDRQELIEFYHSMYLPTMEDRHGQSSHPMSVTEASIHFEHGFLMKISRGGEWVAGTICQPKFDTLASHVIGVRNADHGLFGEGVQSAAFYGAIKYANEHGYKYFSPMASVACLNSGLFQYKRKWGSLVSLTEYVQRSLWFRVLRDTPAVRRYFQDYPPIILDKRGELLGIIFVESIKDVTGEMIENWRKCYTTPGLASINIRPFESLTGHSYEEILIPFESSSAPVVRTLAGEES